jgi:alpha-L-rhamnosidase
MSVTAGPPRHLRCEQQVDPIGIDAVVPRLSWVLDDDRRGAIQTAYQVLVASTEDALAADNGDRWDTGKTAGAESHLLPYQGQPLRSRDRSWWKVRTWDAQDVASPWSAPASFEMGLLSASTIAGTDWRAQPVRSSVRGTALEGAPSPYFRRTFTLESVPTSARLYITAFGLYDAWLNGHRVTQDVLRPGWTDYRLRVPYQTYDVTDLLQPGENVLGAILGDGWYCGYVAFGGTRQLYGERPALVAQLEVDLPNVADPVLIRTGKDWRTTTGPILAADNYMGETYDARLELDGWVTPGYDDSGWEPVEVGRMPLAELVSTVSPPIRRTEERPALECWESAPGTWVYDLGQNIAGWVRLRVTAPSGTEVRIRHAEMLNPDRSVWLDNLGTAKATDTYTCRGGGEEVWEPRFTFHGFRYVEISGLADPGPAAVTGVVVHSDMPRAGEFSCSNPLVSRLYENTVWSQRGNFLDVPTDCPQRAERLGWTGDVVSFIGTALFNFDVSTFLTKWVTDLLDAQVVSGPETGQFPIVAPRMMAWGGGPAWSDAAIVVPWELYGAYGDTRVLEQVYPSLLRWMAFLERQASGRTPDAFAGFGDWVSLDTDPDNPLGFDDRWGGTSLELLRVAFYAHAADLMARIGRTIGASDEARWSALFEQLRSEFVASFVEAGRLKEPTQTACALALHFDLLPDEAQRKGVSEQLVEDIERRGHLVTGFVGTPYLLDALTAAGRVDLAYLLVEREELPGWLYQVKQGATTTWERWDAWTHDRGFHPSGMNSFNHYAYGAVAHWLHRRIGGVERDDAVPGYRRLRFAPMPGGSITTATTALETPYGRAECGWRVTDGVLSMDILVPANTEAEVRLPQMTVDAITESGEPLGTSGLAVSHRDGALWCAVGAGRYSFVVRDPLLSSAG